MRPVAASMLFCQVCARAICGRRSSDTAAPGAQARIACRRSARCSPAGEPVELLAHRGGCRASALPAMPSPKPAVSCGCRCATAHRTVCSSCVHIACTVGDDLGVGGVGVLQLDHVRHLGVHVDAALRRQLALQRRLHRLLAWPAGWHGARAFLRLGRRPWRRRSRRSVGGRDVGRGQRAGRRPGRWCATPAAPRPACASAPSAKSSTRVIMVVKPAGPPGGLGVKALARSALPATSWVPSRTSDGSPRTAGLTWMVATHSRHSRSAPARRRRPGTVPAASVNSVRPCASKRLARFCANSSSSA